MSLSLNLKCGFVVILIAFLFSCAERKGTVNKQELSVLENLIEKNIIISRQVDPKLNKLRFYWKSKSGNIYKRIGDLKDSLLVANDSLVFAMNGGMYLKDHSPQGLYIENGRQLAPLDTTTSGYGNFYMQPNGVFCLKADGTAEVKKRQPRSYYNDMLYATQSGPMLVIDGELHPKFIKQSTSLFVRNGVGILPNGNVLFAISKKKINFYNFATFFKENGCENALYLDGFVSKMYLPANQWNDEGGDFGVIIGEIY